MISDIFGPVRSIGVRPKGANYSESFEFDFDTDTCYIPVGCVKAKFELRDIRRMFSYYIPEPQHGWKTEFTDEEKQRFRPIAETLAMLDGNAFFGNTVPDKDGIEREWYEQYLPEAYALFQNNGGDNGWASESSFGRKE